MKVLVGTYLEENRDWVENRRLFNLPLPDGADAGRYGECKAAVLACGDNAPAAFEIELLGVVDSPRLAKCGCKIPASSRAERHAVFAMGGGLRAEELLSDPKSDLCVCPLAAGRKTSGKYTAVELFAGAGGLSIGLEKAGIDVVIANELMSDFADTLAANHPNTKVIKGDVHKIDFKAELAKLGLDSVDVLSGGPPCQGFSTIGSKNRQDPRNSLFYEYLRAVSETRPKYTIFENVSGFKRMYGGFAYETLVKEMDALGYDTRCQILNAADYGAPQIRFRTIVLGWRKDLPAVDFPAVTHGDKCGLKPYVTLMDAIGDLPELSAGGSVGAYSCEPRTDYQRKMRGDQQELLEHNASKYGEKMQEILRILPEGGSIKDLPARLRPKSGYANTYARLLPDVPSPTITRNFGTPSSSRCVHPFQPRALSTREGARLQGFPDGYRFVGGKQSKNLQIGNAVPPILGEAIADAVGKALAKAAARDADVQRSHGL